jgi:hypothetical protein
MTQTQKEKEEKEEEENRFRERRDAIFKDLVKAPSSSKTKTEIRSATTTKDDEKSKRRQLIDGLEKRGISDVEILKKLNSLDDDRVVSILSHFNARLQNTSKRGKVRNPRNFLKSMLRRVEMDTSGRYKKYDLSNVDDMTSGSNSRAAASFFSEIRSKKRSREDEKPAPPPCSRGAVKFKARAKKKSESPSSKRRKKKKKKRKQNLITLSHLEDEEE